MIILPNGVRILKDHLSSYKPYGEKGIMFTVGEQVETYTFKSILNKNIALVELDDNFDGLEKIYIKDDI